MGVGVRPSPTRSQSNALPLARTSSPTDRLPSSAVPPAGEPPFAEVLSAKCLEEAVREITVPWKDRIFSPLVTLWVFLGQVLAADPSCRAAVARLIAQRVARGLR